MTAHLAMVPIVFAAKPSLCGSPELGGLKKSCRSSLLLIAAQPSFGLPIPVSGPPIPFAGAAE